MPSDPDRVYIENENQAPEDALVRESEQGNLYYTPAGRGRNHHTGGDKQNSLLDTERGDLQSKGRVYISDPSEAPNAAIVGQEPGGPLFYRREAWDEAQETYPEELEDDYEFDMPESEEADGAEKGIALKGRVYISDQSEAPDDVNVEEGAQGGYYYETGGSTSDSEESDEGSSSRESDSDEPSVDSGGQPDSATVDGREVDITAIDEDTGVIEYETPDGDLMHAPADEISATPEDVQEGTEFEIFGEQATVEAVDRETGVIAYETESGDSDLTLVESVSVADVM